MGEALPVCSPVPEPRWQPLSRPGGAVPVALSYLVSCGSLLAVGALQEPRLFGKFI